MLNEEIFGKILKSREDRRLKQEEIIKHYPFSLISFTLNIPGETKDNSLYRSIHNEGMKAIEKLLAGIGKEIKYKEVIYKSTGTEGFISVNVNPELLKQLSIDIEENHPLGRIFDIDVFDLNHDQVSRTHINKEPRQCIICEQLATNCIRAKTHRTEELIKRIQDISIKYFR